MKPLATAAEPETMVRVEERASRRPSRPFYWSVRRELWEHRAVYLAPVMVGAFAVLGLVIHGITMPSHLPAMLGTDPAAPAAPSTTYMVAAFLMLATAFVLAVFYCLEALYSERRDRSILFWKSLPVSDRTTVAAKVSIPLVILPVVTLAVIVAMHAAMFLLSAATLAVQGQSVGQLWNGLQLFRTWQALAYAVAAIALWHAPIYAVLLLASAWATRTAALWVVLPVLAIGLLEKLTMDTARVAGLVGHRLTGWYGEAFLVSGSSDVPFSATAALTPARLLTAPALWVGLVIALLCVAAAVRVRRSRASL